MRTANIMAGVASVIWLALALLGRSGLSGIVVQQATGYPNMAQINFYAVWPLFVVVALLACASVVNAFRRWHWALALFSGVSIAGVLPYLFLWAGGI